MAFSPEQPARQSGRCIPCLCNIVELEFAVWRHQFRLDRREIYANDMQFRVLIGKVDGPYAGASAEVEDTVKFLPRTENQSPIAGFQPLLVKYVQTLLLLLVVRQCVPSAVDMQIAGKRVSPNRRYRSPCR